MISDVGPIESIVQRSRGKDSISLSEADDRRGRAKRTMGLAMPAAPELCKLSNGAKRAGHSGYWRMDFPT
jgi:hypothetical protein